MKERPQCEVVSRAKDLAIAKGLNPSDVSCFREKNCTGTTCAYTKVPNVTLEPQTSKFYKRLEENARKNP